MAIIQNLEAFVQSYPAGLDSVTDLQLSQNENGRQIRFTIGGVTIPAGSVATISGTKPDGVVYSNTGTIEGSDTVIFDEDVQMTAVFGTWYAKIRITNAGNTIASARVRFIIDKDPVDAGAIPSESQLNGLVAEAEEYAGAAEDAAERAAITYGSPLTAATASAMTDINRVYVYTGSESGYTYGNWYYYNGSAWVSGGVYNSAAVETDTTLTESGVPADAKATGDDIDALKDDLEQIVPGLTDEAKDDLLACFAHVAWINADGQNYYDALEDALYPQYPMISVSFDSRGHVVFTSDSLDSLKGYLTVTYFEARGSEGVVLSSSEYTLSGTLSSGSNSITVLYSTLRANFDVIAVAMTVPSGYTRKDYVKIKGSYPNGIPTAALLLVNTGYDLNTLSYFVDLYVEQQISGTGGIAVFGGRSASGSVSSVAMYYNCTSFTLGVHVHGSDPGVISGFENVIQLQKIYHTSLVNGSASPSVLSTGEESRNIAWTNSNVVNVPLAYLVNKNNADSSSATNYMSSNLRLGIFEIKNISNETIRYLIPVVRDSDSVIGICDGITGAFYCPSSTDYSKIGNSNCKYEVGMW